MPRIRPIVEISVYASQRVSFSHRGCWHAGGTRFQIDVLADVITQLQEKRAKLLAEYRGELRRDERSMAMSP